jgi:hypothetical protein
MWVNTPHVLSIHHQENKSKKKEHVSNMISLRLKSQNSLTLLADDCSNVPKEINTRQVKKTNKLI